MGERLVIEVKRDEKPLAAVYYHWSAYTHTAITLLSSMFKKVLAHANVLTDDELQLELIHYAERCTELGFLETEKDCQNIMEHFEGIKQKSKNLDLSFIEKIFLSNGGLCSEDYEFALSKFPGEIFTKDVDRSVGIVGIDQKTIQRMINSAAALISVDLSSGKISNQAIDSCSISEYLEDLEYRDEEYVVEIDDIPRSPVDLGEFTFDELGLVEDVLDTSMSSLIKYSDTIFQLREA